MPIIGKSYNPKSKIAKNDIDNKSKFSLSSNEPKEASISEETKVKEISEFLNKLDKSQDIIGLSGSLIAEYEKLTKANIDRSKKIGEHDAAIIELKKKLSDTEDTDTINSINKQLANLTKQINMLNEAKTRDIHIIKNSFEKAKKLVPEEIKDISTIESNVKDLYKKATEKYIEAQLNLVVALKSDLDTKENKAKDDLRDVNQKVDEVNKYLKKQEHIDNLKKILGEKSPQTDVVNRLITLINNDIDIDKKLPTYDSTNKENLLDELDTISKQNLKALKNEENNLEVIKGRYTTSKHSYQAAKAKYEGNETKLNNDIKKLDAKQQLNVVNNTTDFVKRLKDSTSTTPAEDKQLQEAEKLLEKFNEIKQAKKVEIENATEKKDPTAGAPEKSTKVVHTTPLVTSEIKKLGDALNNLKEKFKKANESTLLEAKKLSIIQNDIDENQKNITKLTTEVDLLKKLSEAYESLDTIEGNDLGAAYKKRAISENINRIKSEITTISGTDITAENINTKDNVGYLIKENQRLLKDAKHLNIMLTNALADAKQQAEEAQINASALAKQVSDAEAELGKAQEAAAQRQAEADKLAKADVTAGNPSPNQAASNAPTTPKQPSQIAKDVINKLETSNLVSKDSKIQTSDGGFTCKTKLGFDCKIEQNGSGNIKIEKSSWATDGKKKEEELTNFLKETGWTEIQLKADGKCGIPEENIANVIKALQSDNSVERNITVKQGGKVFSANEFLREYEAKQQTSSSSSSPTVTGSKAPLKNPDPKPDQKLTDAISTKVETFVRDFIKNLKPMPVCITSENATQIQSDITTAIVAALRNDSDVDTQTIKISDDIISQISTNLEGKPDATAVFDAIKTGDKFIEGITKAVTEAKAEISKQADVVAYETVENTQDTTNGMRA